jgi:hypothetical protein
MLLEFVRDFAPDKPLSEGGGGSQLSGSPIGVIPVNDKTFAPFGSFTEITSAAGIGGDPIGLFSFRASNGTYYTIGGYDTHLKLVNGTNWTDVSRTSGGAYAVAAGDRWYMTNLYDRIIATNYTDVIQSYIAGTDTDFAALAGSPPKAKYVTTTANTNQVVLGYINDGGTIYPQRVQWSKINDPETWTPAIADQSGFQDMPYRNGAVTQVVGGDYITVFQERAITRGTYVGGDQIYLWDEVVKGIGCAIPSSVVAAGDIFFISRDGFKRFNGSSVLPIGHDRVDSTFWANVNRSALHNITSYADPSYPVVGWAWMGSSALTDQSYILLYNYVTDRWALIDLETVSLDNFLNIGVVFNSTYPDGVVAGFADASTSKLGSFTGTAYEGQFLTPMVQPPANGGNNVFLRCQIISENAPPTDVRLQYPSGSASSVGLISAGTQAVLTASENGQWTGTITTNAFRIIAKMTPWTLGKKLLSARILEIGGTGKR